MGPPSSHARAVPGTWYLAPEGAFFDFIGVKPLHERRGLAWRANLACSIAGPILMVRYAVAPTATQLAGVRGCLGWYAAVLAGMACARLPKTKLAQVTVQILVLGWMIYRCVRAVAATDAVRSGDDLLFVPAPPRTHPHPLSGAQRARRQGLP